MAISVTLNKPTVFGDRKVQTGTVTLDSSYSAGGETLTAATLGLSSVDIALFEPGVDTGPLAILLRWSSGKLYAFWSDDSGDLPFEEVDDTQDLSLYTAKFLAIGANA